jgi:hypothetical protein
MVLPSAVLVAMQGSDYIVFLILTTAVMLVGYLAKSIRYVLMPKALSNSRSCASNDSFWISFALVSVTLFWLAFHVGFSFTFNFSDVYERRFIFNESLTFPFNYLLPFVAGPLMAYLTAVSLRSENYFQLMIVILGSFVFYALSTHKAYLFSPFFAGGCYYLTTGRFGFSNLILIVLSALSAIAIFATGSVAEILGEILANRLIFLPSQISFSYFKEFSELGFMHWSESKFGLGIYESPLPVNSMNYISAIVANDPVSSANVGWVGSGYMNSGVYGILFYSLILSALLGLLDYWGERSGLPFMAGVFGLSIFNVVVSVDLFISLVTGGVLVLVFVFYFVQVRSGRRLRMVIHET